jgi:hypothetical protein
MRESGYAERDDDEEGNDDGR